MILLGIFLLFMIEDIKSFTFSFLNFKKLLNCYLEMEQLKIRFLTSFSSLVFIL